VIETRTAVVTLEYQGTVCVRVRRGAAQTLEDARANMAAALDQCGDKRRPILIDIRVATPLDAEVRRYYSGTVLVDSFTSMALLINASPLGRMIGNVYLRVASTGIPTRLFTDEPQAHAWLRNHA
jgi:hypothetical protein